MNHINKKSRRLLALFIAITMLLSVWIPVSAAEPNTQKEEVAYINLNTDGSVREINVVNIFDLDEGGKIIDYGKYQSLRNMTTTDEIGYSNDTVTIDAAAGKLYYEGKLDSRVIPWNISIHYYIDGTEYTGEEIAGMSGAFKMTIDITENTSCTGSFFDNYALQASVTLDTDQCKNISAPDATIANVGSDKQLTYTILPGKGAEIEIEADVTDFKMEGLSINGIPLNLNVEVDDEELMDRIAELLEAIEELDDGAGELYDGVSELQNGVQTDLQDGVSSLKDGASQLYSGTARLQDGGVGLQSGAADLQNGSATLDKGIQSLNEGIGQIQSALNSLNAQSETLTGGSSEFKAALLQLQSALANVSVTSEDLSALTSASSSIKTGIDDMVNGITALQENVSFAAYKAAMSQNGLDIDALQSGNREAIASINNLLGQMDSIEAILEGMGIPADSISPWKSECVALANELVTLLQANNASIMGTESYLTTIRQNLSKILEGATTLQENYAAFDSKIGELADTLGSLAYQMSSLAAAVNSLVAAYEELDSGIIDYTDAVAQIVAGYSQIFDGAAQLVTGSGSLVKGTQTLYSSTGELLSGIVEIYNGTGTLYDGTGELDEGVAELLVGVVELYDGTGKLKDGTAVFREETAGMNTEINDKIDELIESISGGNLEMESFVSNRNTEVSSVQFVIQTEGIQIDEADQAVTEEVETLNLWQKFLRLFGLY